MKSYKESGLYKLGLEFQRLGKVLANENSTMKDVVKEFNNSRFKLEFRLVFKDLGELDNDSE